MKKNPDDKQIMEDPFPSFHKAAYLMSEIDIYHYLIIKQLYNTPFDCNDFKDREQCNAMSVKLILRKKY